MRWKRRFVLLAAAGLATAGLTTVPSDAAEPEVTDGCVDSVPEPGSSEPVAICYTLYRPAGADTANPAPVVFHSHGWGGSRTSSPTAFGEWLGAGFGVISFDQRGFGESGGKAHVEHPDFEGQDVQRLVDLVAAQDWVARETPTDPTIGAIGGSYGGGYQFVGAFTELRDRGATRFDVLAPEITWWDLKESLAPSEVTRTAWVSVLYAIGAEAHTDGVHKGFAYGAATGNWPKGEAGEDSNLDAFFEKNGPAWHVRNGRQLDIPVLFGQGITDNLFNLNQGLNNFRRALTPAAQDQSLLVGYNGGHALPNLLPPGASASGDPCSTKLGGGSFGDLTLQFFRRHLRGESIAIRGVGRYHLATAAGRCVTVERVGPNWTRSLGDLTATTGAGVPQYVKIADGPITVAGVPRVDATVTSAAVDGRAFFALATGTSAANARVVQNNMLPLREPLPVVGVKRTIDLPAVAVTVPAGESLFLTVSPVSDMSFGHGSRTPGVLLLDDTVVKLPVVKR